MEMEINISKYFDKCNFGLFSALDTMQVGFLRKSWYQIQSALIMPIDNITINDQCQIGGGGGKGRGKGEGGGGRRYTAPIFKRAFGDTKINKKEESLSEKWNFMYRKWSFGDK